MNTDISTVAQLVEIMRRLRDPETGCIWDRKQTFSTIAPFTIEEAYEVADAIDRGDFEDLKDELGDLLFQVVFHAQMASESGAFDFSEVAQSIVDKMIRRHPHVFGSEVYETEEELKAAWEAIKSRERLARLEAKRAARGSAEPIEQLQPAVTSAIDGVAANLPALKRADKLQRRAARVGFDWSDTAPVWDKLKEEVSEVKAALVSGDCDAVEDEIGDLLFTVVNLARHSSVDSEQALRRATAKFEQRFKQVETLAREQSLVLESLTDSQLDALWERSKLELDGRTDF